MTRVLVIRWKKKQDSHKKTRGNKWRLSHSSAITSHQCIHTKDERKNTQKIGSVDWLSPQQTEMFSNNVRSFFAGKLCLDLCLLVIAELCDKNESIDGTTRGKTIVNLLKLRKSAVSSAIALSLVSHPLLWKQRIIYCDRTSGSHHPSFCFRVLAWSQTRILLAPEAPYNIQKLPIFIFWPDMSKSGNLQL